MAEPGTTNPQAAGPGRPAGLGFPTRAIHVGQDPDPATGAVVGPIFQTSTFARSSLVDHPRYEYSRVANPTRDALELCLAALEDATSGFAFPSGMAGEDAVARLLGSGDHVIIPDDLYGGTYRLFTKVHAGNGIRCTAVHMEGLDALAEAWQPSTKMVWIETPSNPHLRIVDIEEVSGFARERGALVVVDNTFATPYLQQPLYLGADVVVHSTTKYLGGHSDVLGGFVATRRQDLAERLAFIQQATGAVASPLDCFLVLRGVKTLAVRMDRHCQNAAAIAAALEEHPAVKDVYYPGLPRHPGHAVAARQMRSYGGMVSFTLGGGRREAAAVVEGTRLFTLADSLGGVESLIGYPSLMSHASMANSPLAVSPGLVRLSVGLEDLDDLLADLLGAIEAAAKASGAEEL